MSRIFLLFFLFIWGTHASFAETGYELWMRYVKIDHPSIYALYRNQIRQLVFPGDSPTIGVARQELNMALKGLLSLDLKNSDQVTTNGALIVGTPKTVAAMKDIISQEAFTKLGDEGYLIRTSVIHKKTCIVIAANTDLGVLYGVFGFIRKLQTQSDIRQISISESPKIKHRVLNHWDNLNGTVERGYAGYSLWDWQRLPGYTDPRFTDYARANASIGINGTVLNNVNASAKSLTLPYIIKAAALADVFRPYGIKVYLTARFSAPMEIGGLKTTDPLDPAVRKWWKDKADEIYKYIPDFGGFLVKANSEGQPGPQDYKRTHSDGANMMAEALEPHGGIVMWRAFVYQNKPGGDRAMQAYDEFKPLDGKFNKNVLLQTKNGPLDFQPREPFHPLFGSMPKTPLMLEFEITQEYLGFATHLVYLAPLFKECLDAETFASGKGSTIARIVEGSEGHTISGICAVPNIGTDMNWCGHPFAQANWFAFGRLAWNPENSSEEIADQWIRMTFTNDPAFVVPVKSMMINSRETVVNYMTPLGLTHIMESGTHYGPGPWSKDTQSGYHRADSTGIGYDRSSTGSNAVSQYFSPLRETLDKKETCPEKYLLWFHHVSWGYKMASGKTLWEDLVYHYYAGVDSVSKMQQTWDSMEGKIDRQRFLQVKQLLAVQKSEAEWWRNGCVLYFQKFSKKSIPSDLEKPGHSWEYYKNMPFPYEWN